MTTLIPSPSDWLRGDAWTAWAYEQDIPLATKGAAPEMVWLDKETTGLSAAKEVPLEIGIILTDKWGRLIRDGAARWLIFDSFDSYWNQCIQDMEPFVREMHEKSGLLNELANLTKERISCPPQTVENQVMHWLGHRFGRTFEGKEKLPSFGSSAGFDRKFLEAWMPDLNEWFHYRVGDVTSFRIFASLHCPDVIAREPQKREMHRPIPDLIDSIRLYRHLMCSLLLEDQARS